jgi:hypothetical protein
VVRLCVSEVSEMEFSADDSLCADSAGAVE